VKIAPLQRPPVNWRALGKAGLLTLALAVDLWLWGFNTKLETGGDAPLGLIIASAIAVFTLLYFQSRWPRIVFLVAWCYCVVWGALLASYQPFTALLIALYYVARHLPLRRAFWLLLLAIIPLVINTHDATVLRNVPAAQVVLVGLIWSVIFGAVWVVGRWGRRAAQATKWREEKLAAETALALQNQRLTLARELHDIVAHSVGAIIFQAAGARHMAELEGSRTAQSFEVIEACGVRAVDELRDLLGMLNSAADAANSDGPTSHLSLEGVESLLDLTRLSGVSVELHREGEPRTLSAHADHTAYRLVQESLTNAAKHSGNGVKVDVTVGWHPDWVDIAVVSSSPASGAPPTSDSGGYGLAGMRHRVTSLGGLFESGWLSEGTFCVKAQIPTDHVPLDGHLAPVSGGRSR
jgi:signal transduction histidine kinase